MIWSLALGMLTSAHADPCGMVPPIWTGRGQAPVVIERQGVQETYVFHRDGVQTIAIRPGFSGSVEQFGMLVPLPSVPALRKIDDRTFGHLAAAVDPPVFTVHVVENYAEYEDYAMPRSSADEESGAAMVLDDAVRVVSEEAVGMYEVAVLEAGSPRALQRWMDNHDFRYPDGMDETVADYVSAGWMFVAIKARVAGQTGVAPRPGMRDVQDGLPPGASFDGYVQGMAFRFEVDEPVIPMRLSTYNGGDTHNRVYVLAEGGVRIDEVSAGFVRRQVGGRVLHNNLTKLLPMVFSGPEEEVPRDQRAALSAQRDPEPYNGVARDLFASDLMAVGRGELSLPFEEREKELLRINEALALRGVGIDRQVDEMVASARAEAVRPALSDLYEMTLTVVDGTFDPAALRRDNLHVSRHTMASSKNRFEVWNDRPAGPETYFYYER